MKAVKDLRKLNSERLRKRLEDDKKQLSKFRSQTALKISLERDSGKPRRLRREIARILTILKERVR